ncbi:MAG: hypothetical protein FJ042_06470 [Candidatus Cloacimonetes bacterium]|nr:hypothetical protein [Candidatus Cloacimonadota bacterium]
MKGRILYFSYFYPPLAGPAVLCNLKTVKYLTFAGWEVDVVTISDIQYLLKEKTLLSETRQNSIIRTSSIDPGAILKRISSVTGKDTRGIYLNTSEGIKRFFRGICPLDEKVGWVPFAYAAGLRACRQKRYDLLYVACQPFSAALAVYYLSKVTGIPYVLDMDDYWTLLRDYAQFITPLHRLFAKHWEMRFLERASLIAYCTGDSIHETCATFGEHLREKMITVYNGWDEEDFTALPDTEPERDIISFSYFGNLSGKRNFRNLFTAFRNLRQAGKLPTNVRIRLFGNYFAQYLREISESGITDIIEHIPHLPHRQALTEMMRSTVLVIILNASVNSGVVPSKSFEYLRTGRHILALTPHGFEMTHILHDSGHDYTCPMESVAAIEHQILRILSDLEAGLKRAYQIPWQYERKTQIALLDKALENLRQETTPV